MLRKALSHCVNDQLSVFGTHKHVSNIQVFSNINNVNTSTILKVRYAYLKKKVIATVIVLHIK